MKISEIVQRVQKTKQNEDWVDTEKLGYDLGIYHMEYVEQERITSYFFASWTCNDTIVGYKVYFFDDAPVMISTQLGGKSDEEYAWISVEYAKQVKEYLLSLLHKDDDLNITTLNLEYDFGDYFHIDFNNEILSHHKFYIDDGPVKIIEKLKDTRLGIDRLVKIEVNGKKSIIDIYKLKIPFYLKE